MPSRGMKKLLGSSYAYDLACGNGFTVRTYVQTSHILYFICRLLHANYTFIKLLQLKKKKKMKQGNICYICHRSPGQEKVNAARGAGEGIKKKVRVPLSFAEFGKEERQRKQLETKQSQAQQGHWARAGGEEPWRAEGSRVEWKEMRENLGLAWACYSREAIFRKV